MKYILVILLAAAVATPATAANIKKKQWVYQREKSNSCKRKGCDIVVTAGTFILRMAASSGEIQVRTFGSGCTTTSGFVTENDAQATASSGRPPVRSAAG